MNLLKGNSLAGVTVTRKASEGIEDELRAVDPSPFILYHRDLDLILLGNASLASILLPILLRLLSVFLIFEIVLP